MLFPDAVTRAMIGALRSVSHATFATSAIPILKFLYGRTYS